MPVDIALRWDPAAQECAWAFANNDLVTDDALLTPVLVSLFTDARAADDDPLPDDKSDDKRGWWGDRVNVDMPDDRIGSKLWLLERAKALDDAVRLAQRYAQDALQWMVNEGLASRVDVTVESQAVNATTYMLALQVRIYKPAGTTEAYKFNLEWRATANAVY